MNSFHTRFDHDALDSLIFQLSEHQQGTTVDRSSILGTIAEAASNPKNVIAGRTVEPNQIPMLDPKPESDGTSAVKIHQYLGQLTPIDAADRRLWSYLSGYVFAEYTADRWKGKSKTWVTDRVLLSSSSLNSQSRNSIARLWHSTQKLYDPDLKYPLSAESGDPYRYAKLMFRLQDIHTALMMRSAGYNTPLMIGFIDAIGAHYEDLNSTHVQKLAKELNLRMSFRSFAQSSATECAETTTRILESILESEYTVPGS